jgi:uncharacterized protein (DUF1778 family)
MKTDPEHKKRSQLNLRLKGETIEAAKFAAAINRQSLSEFVREALDSRAIKVLEEHKKGLIVLQ